MVSDQIYSTDENGVGQNFFIIVIYDTPIMMYPIELFPYQCVVKFSAQTFADPMSIAGWPNLFIMISPYEVLLCDLHKIRILYSKSPPEGSKWKIVFFKCNFSVFQEGQSSRQSDRSDSSYSITKLDDQPPKLNGFFENHAHADHALWIYHVGSVKMSTKNALLIGWLQAISLHTALKIRT